MKTQEILKELKKLKLRPDDLYLLALRQVLLNQTEILSQGKGGGYSSQYINASRKLSDRIEAFIETRK